MGRQSWWPEGLSQDKDGYYTFDDSDVDLDRELFDRCCGAVGRIESTALLFDLCFRDWVLGLQLNCESMAGVVAEVWSSSEYPERSMPVEHWVDLFLANEYSHEGKRVNPPTEPVVLYRGCTPEGRLGMSWTSDPDIARTFAFGNLRGRPTGRTYTATVEPEYLLAYLHGSGRNESEFIVDPAGLTTVAEADLERARSVDDTAAPA